MGGLFYPLILPSNTRFATRQRCEQQFAALGVAPNIVVESDDVFTSAEYVRRGLGVSLMYMTDELADLLRTQIECLSLDWLVGPDSLALYHRKSRETNAMKNFVSFMLKTPFGLAERGWPIFPGKTE